VSTRGFILGVFFSCALGAQPQRVGPAAEVARALPVSSRDVVVDKLLGTVRPDGGVWLVWRQWQVSESAAPVGAAPMGGIYCKLVARNGHEILPSRRLFALDTLASVEPGGVPHD
jgi:hypothetical protein